MTTWKEFYNKIQDQNFEFGDGHIGEIKLEYLNKDIDEDSIIIAYWGIGGCEGHWVHVHEMKCGPDNTFIMSPIVFTLKFITENEREDVKKATNFILELVEDQNMW